MALDMLLCFTKTIGSIQHALCIDIIFYHFVEAITSLLYHRPGQGSTLYRTQVMIWL